MQTQTTKNNPIPLIKPQPPQPIIIEHTKFNYDPKGYEGLVFELSSGFLWSSYTDLIINKTFPADFELRGFKRNDQYPYFICHLNDSQKELLSIWIDRCKGVTL